jgi:hypothetical protein
VIVVKNKKSNSDTNENTTEHVSKRPQYKTLLTDIETKQIEEIAAADESKDPKTIPFEWQTAYKMSPWPDFPDSNRPPLP